MNPDTLGEVLSSRAKLRIEDSLSVRPRTLSELASATGISVQGVLRHLRRLTELGLVEERSLSASAPKARKVYAAKSEVLGDYSTGDLTIVKSTKKGHPAPFGRKPAHDLERMAGDILVQRARIKIEAKRLGRMIDELVQDQEELSSALDRGNLGGQERLMLEVLLTDETMEDGLKVLSRYYGLDDRRSIDSVLTKARRSVGK
jgi:DNA-binding transcriptional ArsR family regulator